MLDAIRWDTDLIHRYDLAGPRYTSYPTAVQFDSQVGTFDLLHALRESRKASRPLSLYVHVPFCANICYYCACNKVITKDRGRAHAYLQRLEQEIQLVACHLDPKQPVEQLHFGGGTPTFLSHDELRQVMGCLRKHFNLLDDDSGDYGIEIDPREADWATMGLLRELGFNRVSIGLQDLDPEVQRAVNRLQSLEETRAVIDAARTLQFRSINIDLIYGLPKQTPLNFARTVEEVIKLQPDRLSVFNYAHLPERFMPQRRINTDDLPSPAEKLLMLQTTIEQLTQAGYRYIGMDHFALPDDELAIAQEEGTLQRNFQGYTTHGHCDSAQLATSRGLVCTTDDRLRREVIQQLICNFSLAFDKIEQAFNIDFRGYFDEIWPQLDAMAADGLIELDARGIRVLPAGRLLVRSVCMVFDAYLDHQNRQRFSRVI